MNLTFKVEKKENTNMSSLVKQMCSLKCHINVDSLSGDISILDMDDENIEDVIDAIGEAFDIIAVDIVPTVILPEPEQPVVTEDSIEFNKLKFNNLEVQEQANKLLRIIYWAMYSNNAKSRDICQFLKSTGAEIAMKYNPTPSTEVSIGDVVDCNYGSHLKGEISGGHVHSVVCDIDNDGMVYVLPITKTAFESDDTRFLPFTAKLDIEYTDIRYTGGTILLKMGRYVNQQRFGEIVGHVSPEFFDKILTLLSDLDCSFVKNIKSGYISSEKISKVEEDENMLSSEEGITTAEDVETQISTEERKLPEDVTIKSDSEAIHESDKEEGNLSVEEYLFNIVSDSLSGLDNSLPIEDQVEVFLDKIGMSNVEIIKKAFVASIKVNKIGYKSIIIELHNYFPKLREEIIRATLKEEFKKWLAKYPDVKDNYPKASIMSLIKVFAKKKP